jgi:hypothetical protein
MTAPRIEVVPMPHITGTLARANVWTDKGHSSKTFATYAEAQNWAKLKVTQDGR